MSVPDRHMTTKRRSSPSGLEQVLTRLHDRKITLRADRLLAMAAAGTLLKAVEAEERAKGQTLTETLLDKDAPTIDEVRRAIRTIERLA